AERALAGEQASEVGFKRIEERKRFQRVHVVEISAKSQRMFAGLPCEVIDDLFAALLVKIRIAPVHAGRKGIQYLQVRLGSHRGKIEGAMPVLETRFVEKVRGDGGSQAAHQGLVAQVVVFEAGRQIKAVIQRRYIGQSPVIKEVAQETILAVAEGVVQLEQEVIVIAVAGGVEPLHRQ